MPGASGASSAAAIPDCAGRASGFPKRAFDGFARHAAGPQQHRLAEAGDDGGFDADRRRAAIDNEIDAPAQIGQHVRRRGRRDVAGAVGRRRHDRLAERGEDLFAPPVVGHAHRDAVEARRRQLGDRASAALASTSVSGPGQNASASRAASALKRASARAAARSTTWAISGLNAGRPLAS